MFRILVVEDSKPILRDIVRQIEKAGLPFEIKTAYDGDMALSLLPSFHPDILFTDIKLPFADGLTLIGQAKLALPLLKCVIISGYENFEYTHQALMLQVDDYLLKPVEPGRLQRILTSFFEQLKSLTRHRQEEQIAALLLREGHEITGLPSRYAFMLIRVGLVPRLSGPLSRKAIEDALGDEQEGLWIAETPLRCERMILCSLETRSLQEVDGIGERLLQRLQGLDARINLIRSREQTDILLLHEQYRALSQSLTNQVRLEGPCLYSQTEASQGKEQKAGPESLSSLRKRLECFVKNQYVDDFRMELRRNMALWGENQYSVALIRRFVVAILETVSVATGNGDVMAEEEWNDLADQFLNDSLSLAQLEECIVGYFLHNSRERLEKTALSVEVAGKIESYMRDHVYGTLTLGDIADAFALSPSYICRLIKVYYNDTPIGYYNRLKMEEAKGLMLGAEDIRVKDVAELLGFSDPYYFSKVFKLQYGTSPKDFRAVWRQE